MIIFGAISLILLFVCYFIMKRAVGILSLKYFMPLTYTFFITLMLTSLIGITILVLGWGKHPYLLRITQENMILSILVVYYVVLMIPLVMIVINKVLKINIRKEIISYLNKPINSVFKGTDNNVFYLMLIVSISAILIAIYVLSSGAPIIDLITGKDVNLHVARTLYKRNYGGSELIRNIIGSVVIPLSSYICFCYAQFSNKTKWKVLFSILSLCTILIMSASLEKASIANYIISILFLIVIIKGKISIKKLLSYAFLVMCIVLIAYLATGYTKEFLLDITNLLFIDGPIARIVMGQIIGLPIYFTVFPDYFSFLHGQDLGFLRFIGLESIQSARLNAMVFNPTGVDFGSTGVINTLFVGAAYANFGWLGVAFSPIWVACFIQIIYITFLKLPKNPICIGWGVFCLWTLNSGLMGGFMSEFIFNTQIIAACIFAIFLYFVASLFYGIRQKKVIIKI